MLLSVLGLTANDEVRIEPRGGTPPTSLEVFITSPAAPAKPSAKPSALVSAYTGGSSSVPPPAGMKAGAGALKHEQLMSLMESLTPPKDFKAIFDAKYGTTHPRFFDGSFAEAVRAAQTRHRTIVVYLHFPHHEATFPFCVYASPLVAFDVQRFARSLMPQSYAVRPGACVLHQRQLHLLARHGGPRVGRPGRGGLA